MPGRPGRHGAPLPYRLLAGVEPCPGGWLVASAKLQGITLSPQDPEILPKFLDVLDYKPAYDVIALHAPVGLLEGYRKGGRTCEREARKLLGWPRAGAVLPAPSRPAIDARSFEEVSEIGGVSAVSWLLLPKIREISRDIQPYWQRTVFEVHPELSFYQLNSDRPLLYPTSSAVGQKERTELLTAKLHGVDRIIGTRLPKLRASHLLNAAASLWTARRIASRAVSRLPEDPEWDEQGLRMEIVR